MTSVWMKNPKGMEVEIPKKMELELLGKGYSLIDPKNVKTTKPRPKLNVSMPSAQYPYGGYGRVIELLYECFDFNPDSPDKLYIGYPRPIEKTGRKDILITAFEADRLPNDWPELCKQFDVVIVPSQWCKEVFIKSGVIVPVEVMIQGASNFDVVNSPAPYPPFRFLHYNAFSDFQRKGWDLVVRAFIEMFGEDEKVELILKGRLHDNEKDISLLPKKSNIKVLVSNFKRHEIDVLLQDIHCFVFPSRGEGLGLPPIEAMARGIPTITTKASGMLEYSDLAITIEPSGLVPAKYDLEVIANWVEPDIELLKKAMWHVYKNYQLYKDLAVSRAAQVKKRFSLEAQTERFLSIIQKYV